MTRLAVAAALVAVASCGPSPGSPERSVSRGAVHLVGGDRYDKSSYVADDGRMVVGFRLWVTNLGDSAGRSPHPECYVVVGGERHDLQIYENPELAPGEHGWFRAGAPVPRLGHREFDDLEPYCDL